MDFDFFNSLSIDDANKFLRNFLEKERVGFALMNNELAQCGFDVEFRINNIEPVLFWIFEKLKTVSLAPDESLPDWIINSDSYQQGLFSFDEMSNIYILRGGYFLGECFARDNPGLCWAVGSADSAVKNMPVITGFRKSMEMSPLMVLENVYKRMIAGVASTDSISTLVKTWSRYCP